MKAIRSDTLRGAVLFDCVTGGCKMSDSGAIDTGAAFQAGNRLYELSLTFSLCDSPDAVIHALAATLGSLAPMDHAVLLPRNATKSDEAKLVFVDFSDTDKSLGPINLIEWSMLKLGGQLPLVINNPDSGTLKRLFPKHTDAIHALVGIGLTAPGIEKCLLAVSYQPCAMTMQTALEQVAPMTAMALSAIENSIEPADAPAPVKKMAPSPLDPFAFQTSFEEEPKDGPAVIETVDEPDGQPSGVAGSFNIDFVINALTELRRPLTAIIGFGQVLSAKLRGKPIQEHAQEILSHGHQQLELVNNLLTLARAETGSLKPFAGMRINPSELIQYAVDGASAEIKKKGLECIVEIDSGIPNRAYCDGNLLRQTVTSIIQYATAVTKRGKIKVMAAWERAENGFILIVTVRDTSMGFHEDQLKKIFDPILPGDELESGLFEYGSTYGLIMPIAKRLAEVLDGTLTAKSATGLGNTVTLRIPVSTDAPDTDIIATAGNRFKRRRREEVPVKILIIDNHAPFRIGALELMKSTGYDAYGIDNSKRGLSMLKKADDFEIALIDLSSEPLDGYEVASQLRKKMKRDDLILLALTGQPVNHARALACGYNEIIDKPISWTKLNQILQHWILSGG